MDPFEQEVSGPIFLDRYFFDMLLLCRMYLLLFFGMMNGLYQCKVSFDLNPAVYIIVVNNNENILCFCSVMRR